MSRYWWTVWIKVAVLAVVLILAYTAVSKYVKNTFEPYLLDNTATVETAPEQSGDSDKEPNDGDATEDGEKDAEQSGSDSIKSIMEKLEGKLGVYIDYERFIFDYANDYAQRMMEESKDERNIISGPLSN